MKATRAEVYAVLDGERAYQDSRWNASTTPTEGKHSVAEFYLYMEHYLVSGRALLATQGDPKAEHDGLDMLRKVTAMGVACMEQNGVVQRAGFEPAPADPAKAPMAIADVIAAVIPNLPNGWLLRGWADRGATFYTPGYMLSVEQHATIKRLFPQFKVLNFASSDPAIPEDDH